MKRGKGLRHDPARAAERRRRREERRQADGPRPEDVAREARRVARDAPESARIVHDHDAARAWNAQARREGCVLCAHEPPDDEVRRTRGWDLATPAGHHVVPRQDLKRWGLHRLLWDVRNMLPLCRYHHDRHEYTPGARVPRALLLPRNFEFADEIGARFVLEDDDVYPLAA